MHIEVAVVEDNKDLREGLSQLIGQTPDCSCVGAYASCEELLHAIPRDRKMIVLMDIGLPGGISGIQGVERLKAIAPSADVLMLTVYEDDGKIFDSLCAGASGYLLKKTPPAQIIEAIRELNKGGAPMTPKIARRVLDSFQKHKEKSPAIAGLSEREQDVLAGLVNGLSYKMIADQCCISIDTVRTHIKHIYEKLHVNSKAQAIRLAMHSSLSRR
jgi:DNA-binding NarL/FixJ family response regulator